MSSSKKILLFYNIVTYISTTISCVEKTRGTTRYRLLKNFSKKVKKLLTKGERGGMISKLSLSGAARTLKIKQCMTRTKHTQYPLIPTSFLEEESGDERSSPQNTLQGYSFLAGWRRMPQAFFREGF